MSHGGRREGSGRKPSVREPKPALLCAVCGKPFERTGSDNRSVTCGPDCRRDRVAVQMKTYPSRCPQRRY